MCYIHVFLIATYVLLALYCLSEQSMCCNQHTHTHTHTHTHMCSCVAIKNTYIRTNIHTHMYIYIHIYVYIHIYAYIHIASRVQIKRLILIAKLTNRVQSNLYQDCSVMIRYDWESESFTPPRTHI